MPGPARLFYLAMSLFFIGIGLRYAWPRGWTGVIVGYGLTFVGIALCVVVIRRARPDRDR
jgi:hypothetical protein